MGKLLQFPSKNKETPERKQVKVNVVEFIGKTSISLDNISRVTGVGSTLYIYMGSLETPAAYVEYSTIEDMECDLDTLRHYYGIKKK